MSDTNTGYFESDGTPKLRLSYCLYMDILGFQETSFDAYKSGQGDSLLRKLHEVISLQAEELIPDKEADSVPTNYAKLFTDNVVSGQIISSHNGEGEFGFVIMQAMLYQVQLALAGFSVRGAITVGQFFIDDNVVLGPALNEAYTIEQNISRDPRIVLSDQVFKLAKRHMKYYGEPYDSPQNNHILIDLDGKPFVNYLSILFEDPIDGLDDYEVIWSRLKTHKQFIEDNLLKYKKSPHVWSKYQWLSKYHDFFCKECCGLPGYDAGILIDEKFSNISPKRIVRIRTRKPKFII